MLEKSGKISCKMRTVRYFSSSVKVYWKYVRSFWTKVMKKIAFFVQSFESVKWGVRNLRIQRNNGEDDLGHKIRPVQSLFKNCSKIAVGTCVCVHLGYQALKSRVLECHDQWTTMFSPSSNVLWGRQNSKRSHNIAVHFFLMKALLLSKKSQLF